MNVTIDHDTIDQGTIDQGTINARSIDPERLIQADDQAALGLFKQALKQAKQSLFDRFREGVSVVELVREHSALVDLIATCAWHRFMPADEPSALVAVGGYGRRELHPASDIDLMILLEPAGYTRVANTISDLVMFLWDIGLEIGHSVRTVE
jgi:[protein-PII] uridylyltransferase